jgi:hypothetical protein
MKNEADDAEIITSVSKMVCKTAGIGDIFTRVGGVTKLLNKRACVAQILTACYAFHNTLGSHVKLTKLTMNMRYAE